MRKQLCKCPNCHHTDATNYVSSGSHGVEEETISCDCGYNYFFAYGNYEEQVPYKPTMTWNYKDPTKKTYIDPEKVGPEQDEEYELDELPF